jgi:hypothetical protein
MPPGKKAAGDTGSLPDAGTDSSANAGTHAATEARSPIAIDTRGAAKQFSLK